MNNPIPGATYRHHRTRNLYTVQGCLPIKLDGQWVQQGATVYVSNETGDAYVRLTPDFLDAFERALEG